MNTRNKSVAYNDTLGNVILEQFANAKEIWIAVGLMSEGAIEYLGQCTGIINIIVGIDLPTPPNVLRFLNQLSKEARIRFKVYLTKGIFFHPKLYIIRSNLGLIAYVGSGNFTKGGLMSNVELFSIVENKVDCEDLINWFDLYYDQALAIDENFINNYELKTYLKNKDLKKVIIENIDIFKSEYETDYNQFFRQEHFNAFEGGKPIMDNEIAKLERKVVHDRLIQLHEKIYPVIVEKGWDLHPNERKQNITSLYWHSPFNSKELSGLWLYYGKGSKELSDNHRVYNSDLSPIDHIRLQVIVREKFVGIWCAVGKDNGSKTDREAFHAKIQRIENQMEFYSLIKALSDDYYINVNGNSTYVKDIRTYRELYSLVNTDVYHLNKYFIIGIDISPNDTRIREDKIVDFVIKEFEKLYPIYDFMKAPQNPVI